MTDSVQQAIAEQVIGLHPHGSKREWGRAFLALAEDFADDPELAAWLRAREEASLGRYCADIQQHRQRVAQNERLMTRGVAVATGRPINPSLSIRNEGVAQLMHWIEATPEQFIEAVLREQRVVDGRRDANAVRLALVELMKDDERLMKLPTLADVCAELGIDPDTLGLGDLETGT